MSAEQDLSPLKRAFLAIEQLQGQLAAARDAGSQPIAIVGAGCRLPGGIDGIDDFWDRLRDGVDAIGEVPADRWDIDAFYDPDHRTPGKMSTRHGGFIADVDRFEPELFGIAPREAASMDPQQRILLEVCWEALEHAGIAPSSLAGTRTGVFVGMAGNDYGQMMLQSQGIEGLDAYHASGTAHSIASGRLSYVLGLNGPSITVDTACSSSLLAVHLAVQSLRAGESDAALAGGVNLILGPETSVTLSKYQMMSPGGRCKFADASADGFVRAEGCALVVLKRLPDAIAAGDHVLGVIRGTAVSQDGASSGLTAPSGPAQEAVVRAALANARLEPGDVSYVEAHGTGTALGDPIELQALGEVFGARPGERPLVVGSVKTNLGHLESAAGATSLVKVVAMLQHGAIPASLHFSTPTPEVDWDELPLRVPTVMEEWPAADGRRVAGVSSFGFSGTNVHVVVESAPEPAPPAADLADRPLHVLVLSARTEDALREVAARWSDHLREHPELPLADVAHTAATGRSHLAHRLALVAADGATAAAALAEVAAGRDAAGVHHGDAQRLDPPKVAFLFTGQGAQRAGMARELYESSAIVRDVLDRSAAAVAGVLDVPLLDVLFAGPDDAAAGLLDETASTQPALVAVECALAELWRSWGVVPNAVLGHSVGEYAAAITAGVMSLEDGMRLVAERGRLMQSLQQRGAMGAIFAPVGAVAAAVAAAGAAVSIAADNGPAHTVVSGTVEDVDDVLATFAAKGVRAQRLNVSHAFHSAVLDPMLDDLERAASAVPFADPQLRLVSNVTGTSAARGTIGAAYWRRHAREPVRFADGVRELDRLGCTLFVEIGPHPTLLTMGQTVLDGGDAVWLPSVRRGRGEWQQLLDSVAVMHTRGVAVDWHGFDRPWPRRTVALPTYPFRRERHWFEPGGAPHAPVSGSSGSRAHPILGTRLRSSRGEGVFDADLTPSGIDFLGDHRVFGASILPATGFVDTALVAGAAMLGAEAATALADVELRAALVAGDESRTAVQTIVTPDGRSGATFEIMSDGGAGEGAPWTTHAFGRIEPAAPLGPPIDLDAVRARCPRERSAEAHADDLAARGLTFGPSLRGLRRAWVGDGEALAEVAPVAAPGPYHVHPAVLDACLQVFAAITSSSGGTSLPVAIDRIDVGAGIDAQAAVFAHATLRAGSSGAPVTTGDLTVTDERGEPLVVIRGIRFARVDPLTVFGPGRAMNAADWVYERVWEPSPLPALRADVPTTSPAELAAAADACGRDRLGEVDLADALAAYDSLDRLAAGYLLRALTQLGASADGSFTTADLRVAPRHRRLTEHLCTVLAERGALVERAPGAWSIANDRAVAAGDLDADADRMDATFPTARGELEIVRRCGEQLAGALRGEVDPLHLIFPSGSTGAADDMYHGSPFAAFANAMVAGAVAAAAAGVADGRTTPRRAVRILEIGAGTLGTTVPVLDRLQGPIDYTVTDISPMFVERARERLAGRDGVGFRTLDIESDPVAQGFAGHSYDVVVAANVLHATADLQRTFATVASLLAPGGRLVLLEMTTPRLFIDVTFGLTAGWWKSVDADLRHGYPLLDRDGWVRFLADQGYVDATAVPTVAAAPIPTRALGHQTVLVAGAPEPVRRGAWLIVADETTEGRERGVAERLSTLLAETGAAVELTSGGAAADLVATPPPTGWTGVVHVRSLGRPAPSPLATAADRTGSALSLAQAMLASGGDARLWLVTRGGQPVAGGTVDPDQAPLWGLGMVVELEHPELRCTCIDLDPSPGDDAAGALFAELVADMPDRQIAHRAGRRLVARVVPAASPTPMDGRETSQLVLPRTGSLDEIGLVATPRRAPGPGEVEIRVHAAGLNFRDVMNALAMRDDAGAAGSECAGRVLAVGVGVDGIAVGDEVVAIAAGSFAGHVLAPAELVVPKPADLTYEEAATVPLAFLSAWYALHGAAAIRAGETVLVHAAAGGVGLAAIQVARQAGAHVIGTAGTPHKRAFLAGLDLAAVTDSRSTAFVDDVRRSTGGRGVDVVLNSLTGDLLRGSLDVLVPGGRFVELGKQDVLDAAEVAASHHGAGYHTIRLAEDIVERPHDVGALLRRIMAGVEAGELRPLPVAAFPLADAPAAFRYMAQARHIGKVVLTDPAATADDAPVPIGASGAYVVTGGLAGVGLLVAEWLVEQGARHVALVARSEPADAARDAIARMEAHGARVLVVRADVAVREQVAELLDRVDAELAPVRGVLHAAGVLADASLMRQTWDRFATVLAPKVAGATHLDELTSEREIDHFVLFSSVASLFGSRGQANHAAANAHLDALAARRRSLGRPALSVSWGAWADVGSVVRQDLEERIGEQGIVPMAPAAALGALGRLMSQGRSHLGVAAVDWPTYAGQAGPRGAAPWLAAFAGATQHAAPTATRSGDAAVTTTALRDQLVAAPVSRRREMLLDFVGAQVARVLGLLGGRSLDERMPLHEMGLDSLMAVELRNLLGAGLAFERPLPATLVFDHPTVEALADELASRLGVADSAVTAETSDTSDPGADLLDSLGLLSDEDVARLLDEGRPA